MQNPGDPDALGVDVVDDHIGALNETAGSPARAKSD